MKTPSTTTASVPLAPRRLVISPKSYVDSAQVQHGKLQQYAPRDGGRTRDTVPDAPRGIYGPECRPCGGRAGGGAVPACAYAGPQFSRGAPERFTACGGDESAGLGAGGSRVFFQSRGETGARGSPAGRAILHHSGTQSAPCPGPAPAAGACARFCAGRASR